MQAVADQQHVTNAVQQARLSRVIGGQAREKKKNKRVLPLAAANVLDGLAAGPSVVSTMGRGLSLT